MYHLISYQGKYHFELLHFWVKIEIPMLNMALWYCLGLHNACPKDSSGGIDVVTPHMHNFCWRELFNMLVNGFKMSTTK
jgi:hypothetical protein